MLDIFSLTVFLGSFLLFLVEPMAGRAILTRFGGSSSVWVASLLFFQLVLLAGYAWAHYGEKLVGKWQRPLHFLVTILGAAWIISGVGPQLLGGGGGGSSLEVLWALLLLIGLPFFALSANASLLQRWFHEHRGKEPYFLYGASNLGSMLALLTYPLAIEPLLGLKTQLRSWGIALLAVGGLLGVCAWVSRRSASTVDDLAKDAAPVTWDKRILWLILSALPSSLLLGVSSYLTTNVAPVPLLWVVPLALYLLTFIIVFGRREIAPEKVGRWAPVFVAPLSLALVLESSEPLIPLALFHLAVFFVVALACHARLAGSRPASQHVTEFYLYVAIGGAVGGIFNALLAPIVFSTLFEYPLALGLACAVVVLPKSDGRFRFTDAWVAGGILVLTLGCAVVSRVAHMDPSPWRTGLTIGLPVLACFLTSGRAMAFGLSLVAFYAAASWMQVASDGNVVLTERSFFGVSRVVNLPKLHQRRLVHGTTSHGVESLDHLNEPLTYYTRSGPIGRIFADYRFAGGSIGLVGLGVGSLAAYGRHGQTFTFFEIDPVVRKIASDPKLFTFLSDSKAKIEVVPGDGRLGVSKVAAGSLSLLVLDAFTSDSIPVHMITREAMAMYVSKLKLGGLIAYHVSNRYLDLAPVIAAEARDLGLVALAGEDAMVDDDEKRQGKEASIWVVVARTQLDLDSLSSRDDFAPIGAARRAWTDDYSNLFGAMRLGEKA